MADISIIVPVYRVEEYLHRCVDSILAQTYPDFELILIDDGSPDSCGKICDGYAEGDRRIHVIHQTNGGLSAARNSGIDWAFANSSSEWLTFIDSDDWVHPQYLEVLLHAATKHNVSVSIGNALWTKDGQLPDKIEAEPELWKTEDYYLEHNANATVAWGKLYRKECFLNIRYPAGKIHEDEYVTYRILFEFDQLSVVDQPIYGYFQNDRGITRRSWSPKRLDALEGLEGQVSYFLEKGLPEVAHRRFSALVYWIIENIDKVDHSEGLGLWDRWRYKSLLRRELRSCLYRYMRYRWLTLKKNRPIYANTSAVLAFCRKVWLEKIKPAIHNRTSKKQ